MIREFNCIDIFEYFDTTIAGVAIFTALAGLVNIVFYI